MTIRDRIVAGRRERVAREGPALGAVVPAERQVPSAPFAAEPLVICEIKKRSPSRGEIDADLDVVAQAGRYAAAGIRHVSVLTEPDHFGGSLDDLMRIKERFGHLAVLRKDFLLDERDVDASHRTGADAVLSLCSSLGPTIDPTRETVEIPVIKIDDPMTRRAVELGSDIGVMATVPTTLGPTINLIKENAASMGKDVRVHDCLVEGAFQILMGGDKDKHDRMVIDRARELGKEVDIIVFAQASMTRLAPTVESVTGLQVLTSPRLAIEYTKSVLDAIAE